MTVLRASRWLPDGMPHCARHLLPSARDMRGRERQDEKMVHAIMRGCCL